MSDERETVTYEEFGRAARELAQQAADSGHQGDPVSRAVSVGWRR